MRVKISFAYHNLLCRWLRLVKLIFYYLFFDTQAFINITFLYREIIFFVFKNQAQALLQVVIQIQYIKVMADLYVQENYKEIGQELLKK